MMAEILTNHALEQGQNVLVDGSLRDAEWYEQHFQHLRTTYPQLRIGIIHVTAPAEAVFERVKQRAKATGRVVPTDTLIRSMQEVPRAVKRLSQSVDFFLEVYNPPAVDDSSMPQPRGMDPGTIAGTFRQHCAA
jgi:ribose 1,5-bisphosphokinase PhnN